MAVDGHWKLNANTPIGELTGTGNFKSAGGNLTGTVSAEGTSAQIADGSVSGDNFAGKASITQPISLTLSFTGTVSGNNISGEIQAGTFGSFPFTGTRA
jgi:hypothetical protein